MSQTADRLAALRAELASRPLTGFVVPLTDEHQSEYVAPYAQRLAWLTGFTGSAGTAVVLADKAALFIDGRYTLQVADQVDAALFEHHNIADTSVVAWLKAQVQAGDTVGYDPYLHTVGWVGEAEAALEAVGARLVAVDANPVDAVWTDRPGLPDAPAVPHETAYAGQSAADKRALIAATLREQGAAAAVLTALDSIAWAFNIRGRDVEHTPVALAYAIVRADETATLFIDPAKTDDALRRHLGNAVTLQPRDGFADGLTALAADSERGARVLVDPHSASAAVFATLGEAGAAIVRGADPCALPKAAKNQAEQHGARQAHRRDGVAVTRFLAWLSAEAPKGGLDELGAADHLLALRTDGDRFRDASFDTISGAGPNGAIVHYRVTPETNRRIEPGSLYLVDSGGQYLDGTTDITRTVAIGEPGAEERDRFTRVLKGHIALATAIFPDGTTGAQLDALARKPLWDAGLDYDHGTGHGVGSYLGVHEGPQRIAKLPNTVALKPGMILSNEPGYYKTGAYGIRIENLVLVRDVDSPGDRRMLGFETLTLAPIDRHLIEPALLTDDELAWLNAYHDRVRETLADAVPHDVRRWLKAATEPIARPAA